MVKSVRGPEKCCQECSLRAKTYIEWPCSAVFLRTLGILGSSLQDNVRASLGDERACSDE